jgi:hypothetical protein
MEMPMNRRETLLALRLVLDTALPKALTENLKDSKRLHFGRLAVQAASAVGAILKDVELEELLVRVKQLEEKTNGS